MFYYEPTYHIYLNNECIRCNLSTAEFKEEMSWMTRFLELTNLGNNAILDYVQCDPPPRLLADGSY